MRQATVVFSISLTAGLLAFPFCAAAAPADAPVSHWERLSLDGKTLPVEAAEAFPPAEQRVAGDTGVNVLVDLAHQASFFAMWSLPGELRRRGFRATSSQA